jgi:hypothetical protein
MNAAHNASMVFKGRLNERISHGFHTSSPAAAAGRGRFLREADRAKVGACEQGVAPCKRRRNSAILRHVEGSSPTDPRDYDVFLLSRRRRRFLMNPNI